MSGKPLRPPLELPPTRKNSSWETLIRSWYLRIAAAFRFEMGRSLTAARLTAWIVLVAFPAAIMIVFRYHDENTNTHRIWGVVLYLLATQATTLLGLLLWVAPAVQVELEGRTWSYMAVRPGGKLAVLCGKYLSGVAWTVSAGFIGIVAATAVAWPRVDAPLQLLAVLVVLQILAAVAYGSMYLAIGALFPRRAMVFAVVYMLLIEVVVSVIPATIQQLTVQHRLWNLLWAWMKDWERTPEIEATLGDQSPEMHLIILCVYSLALLALACTAVAKREYMTSPEV